MRNTLRRSCDPCARSKLRCDLLLPQCSRCQKKSPSKTICNYANAPLSSTLTDSLATSSTRSSPESEGAAVQPIQIPLVLLSNPGTESFDPFNSYPQTRLPRAHVQRLIQHCMSSCHNYRLRRSRRTDIRQSCRLSLFNIIHLTCKPHPIRSWSHGFPQLSQILHYSMCRFRLRP
jgi:hypothetical protein